MNSSYDVMLSMYLLWAYPLSTIVGYILRCPPCSLLMFKVSYKTHTVIFRASQAKACRTSFLLIQKTTKLRFYFHN